MTPIPKGNIVSGRGCCPNTPSKGKCSTVLNTECENGFVPDGLCNPDSGECSQREEKNYGCCAINYGSGCSNPAADGKVFCKSNPITQESCSNTLNTVKNTCPNASMLIGNSCTGLEEGGLASQCTYYEVQ